MRKKSYKKSRITPRKNNLEKFLFIFGGFLLVFTLCVFSIQSVRSNTTPVYGELPVPGISNILIAPQKRSNSYQSGYMLFSTRLQQFLRTHPVAIAKSETVASNQIIWHGARDKKEIALTFDADMTPAMVEWLHEGKVETYNDPRTIDYLTEHNIKATFFLTGLWIESYPDVTRALADNQLFELENHTYSHPSMSGYCYGQPQIPQSQYPSEIEKVQQLLQQIAHVTPKYFRFSGGCYDQFGLNLVKKEGLVTVHWDDVANDGFNDNEEEIINNVVSEAQNGSIIVMHIGGESNVPQTANALPAIISNLEQKGYTFVTVSELLHSEETAHVMNPKKYLSSLKSFQYTLP